MALADCTRKKKLVKILLVPPLLDILGKPIGREYAKHEIKKEFKRFGIG